LAIVKKVYSNGNVDAQLDASAIAGAQVQANIPHASTAQVVPAGLRPTVQWYVDHAGESLTAGSTSHTTAVPTIAPSIKHQPTEKIVSVGSSVTMQVIAAGSPTPTYQWRKNKVA